MPHSLTLELPILGTTQNYTKLPKVASYFISPVIGILLVLSLWTILPQPGRPITYRLSLFLIITLLGLGLYPLLLSGWASNSKYAILGAIRGVAQTISYEIRLAIILFRLVLVLGGLNLDRWAHHGTRASILALASPLLVLWLVSCVAETNRTPFDFAEGESELVSGFNIEYGGGGFALIFMAEYARIIFIRAITRLLVLGIK